MPVCRPTADSIWNSFRSSSKRHLILTGTRGSGKTTLFSELFPHSLPGITTWAKSCKAVYMKANQSGETVQIASYDDSIQGTKLKMVLREDALCSFGIPVLNRCIRSDSEWIGIDEIGFLEENCEDYKNTIRALFDHKRVAAVVRKQDLPFLNELRSRQDVFLVDLDQPFGNSGCVIMASGLGKRFGENKLMAEFMGKPMICRILEATEGLFIRRVVVTRHRSVMELCEEQGIDVLFHDFPQRSDTIRLGLETMLDLDCCVFCPGDQPMLKKNTVASLLLCSTNHRDTIWRTCCNNIPGSPVLFPRWAFSELLSLPEGKGGSYVVKRYPDKTDMLHISDPRELADVDTKDMLELLKGTLS